TPLHGKGAARTGPRYRDHSVVAAWLELVWYGPAPAECHRQGESGRLPAAMMRTGLLSESRDGRVRRYDERVAINADPFARLPRAGAVGHVLGPSAGLA